MSSKISKRETTFNIPSNRSLWSKLGKYDALVEYQEVATQLMLRSYNPSKESFRDFLKRISAPIGIHLNGITLQHFKEIQYQGYLVFPNASFDDFLTGFSADVRILIYDQFDESKIDGCRFEKILDSLNNIGIKPVIEESKVKLYHYYRLLRNDIAHQLNKDYSIEYKQIDINTIGNFYPNLSKPHSKDSLDFNDFILCTANVKDIADKMTQSLLPHIDWKRLCVVNREKWFPRYKNFIAEKNDRRLRGYIRTSLFCCYGIKFTESYLDQIIGSLE